MPEYYGKVHNKSTVTTKKNYASIEGSGSARSNDVSTLRELSDGLVESVNRANEIAFDAHLRSKR